MSRRSVVATSFTDTGLVNATTYYYVVAATNVYGVSLNSAEASATLPGPVPPPWQAQDIGAVGVDFIFDPGVLEPSAIIATIQNATVDSPEFPQVPAASAQNIQVRRNGFSVDDLVIGGDNGTDLIFGAPAMWMARLTLARGSELRAEAEKRLVNQQWLSTGDFAREFGPSTTAFDEVTGWLHAQGLTHTSPKAAVGGAVTFRFGWQAPAKAGG